MNHESKTEIRIGLFGIGLDTYWPQFKGLKRRLEGYLRVVHSRTSQLRMTTVRAVVTERSGRKAMHINTPARGVMFVKDEAE